MDPKLPWVIGLAVLVSTIAAWSFQQQSERRKQFRMREELDLDTIYFWFFAHRGLPRELVLELWCEVANSLAVPAGKLRPSDRLDDELAERWMLAEIRRLESGGDLVADGLEEIQTVGDYIELLCSLEMQDGRGDDKRGQKSG